MTRVRFSRVELEAGGVIDIPHYAYPEWGEVFESVSCRRDRCWERTSSLRQDLSGRWLCKACRHSHLSPRSVGWFAVLRRKVTLRVKRWIWNRLHAHKIPNSPGYGD